MKTKDQLLHRFLIVLAAGAFTVGVTACGGGGSQSDNSSKQSDQESEDKQTSNSGKEEEQEKAAKSGDEKPMTIEEFADAAKAHIEEEAEEHGGHFIVKDQKTGEKLKLDLDKVHRKRLSHLGNDRYFVCADFTSQDSTLYDVDIFMRGTKKTNLEEAGEPKVHKVEGEPRFTYYQEDGVWKRKPVDNDDQQASKS
jgi:hypothetical protein